MNGTDHPTRGFALGALIALLPGLGGCQYLFPTPIDQHSATDNPSQAVRAIGATYVEGEEITVALSLDGVSAGRGVLRVGKKCLADGKLVIPVFAEGGSSGFLSVFATAEAETFGLIDLDNNSALESRWDVLVGEKRSLLESDYHPGGYRFHQLREEPEKKPKHVRRKVELPTEQVPHDGHSLLGYLRRWQPEPGTRGHVFANVGRSLYRAELLFVGPDSILTGDGSVAVTRIDGTASRINERTLKPTGRGDRPFSLWIANDEARTPVRLIVETDVVKIALDVEKRTVVAVPDGPPEPCASRVDKTELARAKARRKADKPAPPAPSEADPKQLQQLPPKFRLKVFQRKLQESDDD